MVKCDFCHIEKELTELTETRSNLISNRIFKLCEKCIKLKDSEGFFYTFCKAD